MTIAARQRDLETVRAGLARWLRRRRGATDLRVAGLTRPQGSGLSSDTFFVDVEWTEGGGANHETLVARLPPEGGGLFPRYDLVAQARVQRVAGGAGIPVAAAVALEEDESWVGAPFLMLWRVPGRVLTSSPSWLVEGWLVDSRPEEQSRLHSGFVDVLATIHALDWQRLECGFLARGSAPGLRGELEWWSRYLDWASDGQPPDGLVDALAWCRDNMPAPEPPASLLWGDVQMVNAVFDDALQTVAVLDWEMASIGPAEVDIGWFLGLHTLQVETAGADLPGFPDRGTMIAAYERRLGRELLPLRWFEAFALVRSASIKLRAARLLGDAGAEAVPALKGDRTTARLRRLLEEDRGQSIP